MLAFAAVLILVVAFLFLFCRCAMNLPANPETIPFLSVLIFAPLGAALVAALLRNENALRWWTLVFTLAAAAFSLPLFWKFDTTTAAFQFVEHAKWIPWLKVNYTLGVDGISLLLVGTTKGRLRRTAGRGPALGGSAPGEHNFNQRFREEKQRHYATIAQRLFELIRERPVRGVVLAGFGGDVGGVEPHLHPYVAEALLGMARINPKTASEADLLEAVLDLRSEMEREWERHHLSELKEGMGTGWALNGVTATLAALARGQVRTLLVDSTAERAGFRCRADGRLVLSASACGGDAQPVPDVLDEAIEEAFRQGAHVDVVEDPEVQRHVDGMDLTVIVHQSGTE